MSQPPVPRTHAPHVPETLSRARVLVALVAAAGPDGVDVAAIRTSYARHTGAPAPAALGADVGSLVKRGLLVRAGGRAGRTRYAAASLATAEPAGAPPRDEMLPVPVALRSADADGARDACLAADDPAGAVLRALQTAVTRAGGDAARAGVPTAAIVGVLRSVAGARAGPDGAVSAVESDPEWTTARARSLLHTLTRRRSRGPVATQAPLVARLQDPVTGGLRWTLVQARVPASIHAVGTGDGLQPAGAAMPAASPATTRRAGSRTDALRAMLAAARDALGRAPSARDLAWYTARYAVASAARGTPAYADVPARSASSDRAPDASGLTAAGLTRALAAARQAGDRAAAAGVGERLPRIHRVRARAEQSAYAGRASFGADRYGLAPPTPADRLTHALDSAAERLALADELRACDVLARRAIAWRAPALTELAAARRAAVCTAFAAALAPSVAAVVAGGGAGAAVDVARAFGHAIGRAERAIGVLAGWVDGDTSASTDVRAARRRVLATQHADLRAATTLFTGVGEALSNAARDGAAIGVSSAALVTTPVTTADLAPYARAAARVADVPLQRAHRLYQAARRIPALCAGRTSGARTAAMPAGDAPGRPALPPAPPACVDRVDALVLLVDASGAPRARALVRTAIGLLGRVWRDGGPLQGVLDRLAPGDASTRHAVVVARALLGHAPTSRDVLAAQVSNAPAAHAVRGDDSWTRMTVGDAVAFVLATALAGPDAETAAASTHAVLRGARGEASAAVCAVLDTARARLRAGLLLTAAE